MTFTTFIQYNLIWLNMSAQTFFPNQVTFWDFSGHELGAGGTTSPTIGQDGGGVHICRGLVHSDLGGIWGSYMLHLQHLQWDWTFWIMTLKAIRSLVINSATKCSHSVVLITLHFPGQERDSSTFERYFLWKPDFKSPSRRPESPFFHQNKSVVIITCWRLHRTPCCGNPD